MSPSSFPNLTRLSAKVGPSYLGWSSLRPTFFARSENSPTSPKRPTKSLISCACVSLSELKLTGKPRFSSSKICILQISANFILFFLSCKENDASYNSAGDQVSCYPEG